MTALVNIFALAALLVWMIGSIAFSLMACAPDAPEVDEGDRALWVMLAFIWPIVLIVLVLLEIGAGIQRGFRR